MSQSAVQSVASRDPDREVFGCTGAAKGGTLFGRVGKQGREKSRLGADCKQGWQLGRQENLDECDHLCENLDL